MKAILVIDMPDSCFHCQLELYGSQCGANYKNTAGNANKRPSWCPLKPLPQEREFGKRNILPIKVDGNSFALGWNACLKELDK